MFVNARAVLLSLAGLLAGCSASLAASSPSGSWPMYQKVPSHNAVLPPIRGLSAWKFEAGAKINGGLAVAGNTLFLDTFGNELIALDVRSGRVLWRARADNILMSTPVVADGLVYVGSGDNTRLQGQTGASTFNPPPRGLHLSPVWGKPAGDSLLAYDVSTGEKRWQYKTVGEDMPSAAYVNDVLVFANGDLHSYGINAASGAVKWLHALPGLATMASATAAGDRVFLSDCVEEPYHCETIAVDAATGSVAWRAPFGNSDSSPTYGDGQVFVSGIEDASTGALREGRAVVAAIDARTGRKAWVYMTKQAGPYTQVGSAERAIAGTYAGGVYYQAIPTHDELVAFDGKTGRLLWTMTSIAPIKMSPVVSDGRVYVGDTAGLFYEIDARSGRIRTSRLFKQPFTTSPPIVIGNFVLVAGDSTVYALPIRR
ncbi:MAG TPA: PQQ-binding-like beta-propeller repeat protein [Candidatus Rubrimentiphilum sp.]|nr:PQQ-binding-like beta-propeller repeat protein [Candidatus Rubrimentiphilum sp.]